MVSHFFVEMYFWQIILLPSSSVAATSGVFAVGSAQDLDKCAWGESHWCSDLHAAKTCGAFKHCMSTVWKNQKLTEVRSQSVIS